MTNEGSIVYSEQTLDGASNLMRYDMTRHQSQLIYVCKDALCTEVAFRPDGKVVAFDRSALNTGANMPSGAPRIWLLDTTTGQAGPLYSDSDQLGYTPHWSPDGKKLAFYDTSSSVILIHSFSTGNDTSITALQGTVGTGAFSPDGKWFWFPKAVMEGQQQYTTHIVIVNMATNLPTQHDLLPDAALDADTDPIWSTDSQSLLISRRTADQPLGQDKQIYQVDVVTGQAKALVAEPHYTYSNLSLNSTGNQLVFQRLLLGDQEARPELWLYDFKTGQTHKLVDNSNVSRWLP